MAEGVQGVDLVLAVFFGRDEQRAARSEGDVAAPLADDARSDGGCGVVARARDDLDGGREAELGGDVTPQRADRLIALVQFGELPLGNAANGAHFGAPAAVFDVEQQHAARVRKVGTEAPRQPVGEVVFGEHDLGDAGKVLRLVVAQPQNFGRGEAGEGDVARVRRELFAADLLVEVGRFRRGAAVVPEDGGADDVVLAVQCDQPVHLPAEGDAAHGGLILPFEQGGDAAQRRGVPIGGVLLAPAALRVADGVALRVFGEDAPVRRDQQKLCAARAEVDADVGVHHSFLPRYFEDRIRRAPRRLAGRAAPYAKFTSFFSRSYTSCRSGCR